MAKYDEFDLDVQTVKNNAGGNESKSGLGCTITPTIELSLQYCPTRACPSETDKCYTKDTCSICHSYCGGTCKR